MTKEKKENSQTGLEVAIIGMAGRFPGAKNTREFWDNLENSKEMLPFFSDPEIIEAGVDPKLFEKPNYVKTPGFLLDDAAYFDAFFFDYSTKEAEVMSPQTRLLHEVAWEALEDAGYVPSEYENAIGLYAGGYPTFLWDNIALLSIKPDFDLHGTALLSWNEFLTTRVSYKLNLKGPAILIQTACSSSLTAIHTAYRALLTGDCHMALAGGSVINPEQQTRVGYLSGGENLSFDGHHRCFDTRSTGGVAGNAAALVLLKPLQTSIADGDHIYAVIKGSALNNDGMRKVGYKTTSIPGQTGVVRAAHRFARVKPESIGYIEANGIGTILGDSMELNALKKAFNTDKKQFCGVGSVKPGAGHLRHVGGVTGVIKTALALKKKLIPPTLHFETLNPEVDLEDSPFYIITKLTEWKRNGSSLPLRAGVTSLGIGGTNAHIVLEEWDAESSKSQITNSSHIDRSHSVKTGKHEYREPASGGQLFEKSWTKTFHEGPQLILLSARTRSALDKMRENIVNHLKSNPHIDAADLAYTLQVGRKAFEYREIWVCAGIDDAVEKLSAPDPGKVYHIEPGEDEWTAVDIKEVLDLRESVPDVCSLLERIGQLWLQGMPIKWQELYAGEKRGRIPLPTYPFESQRYWFEKDPFKGINLDV